MIRRKLKETEWTAADVNDLPDSSFAYIEPGGEKDEQGKTVPRSKRHFPIKDANGNYDAAHVRNALARAAQSPLGPKALPKIRAGARALGIGAPAEEKERIARSRATDGAVDLYERTVSRPKGVEGRVIKGIAILNSESSNGRYYPPDVMRKAVGLFEGARSYVDHPKDDADDRTWRDLLGRIENVAVEDVRPGHAKTLGDLRVFAGADGDRALKIAQEDPDACGLSIRARGHIVDDGAQQRVESIDRVIAVELVDAPAATKGFFESRQKPSTGGDGEMELKEQLADAQRAMKELETQIEELQKTNESVTKERDELKGRAARAEREAALAKLVSESGLTPEQVSDAFREALKRCEGDEQAKALIEDRKAALGLGEPTSRERHALAGSGGGKVTAPSVDEIAEMVNSW